MVSKYLGERRQEIRYLTLKEIKEMIMDSLRARYIWALSALLIMFIMLLVEPTKMMGLASTNTKKDGKLSAAVEDNDILRGEEEPEDEEARPVKPPLLDSNRHILCFGDSLTFGTNRQRDRKSPLNPHPYAIRVAQILGRPLVQSNGKGNLKEQIFGTESVIENGWPGETAAHMEERLPSALESAHYPGLVIILGGTNDMNQNREAHSIVRNLKNLHYIALNSTSMTKDSKPVNTIHMTIPPAAAFVDPRNKAQYGDKRLKINEEMRKFIRTHNREQAVLEGKAGAIFLIDLEYLYMPIEDNKKMWNEDLLHFSADGYDGIADLVHKGLIAFKLIVEKEKNV